MAYPRRRLSCTNDRQKQMPKRKSRSWICYEIDSTGGMQLAARVIVLATRSARERPLRFSHVMKPDWHAVPAPLQRAPKQNCNLW